MPTLMVEALLLNCRHLFPKSGILSSNTAVRTKPLSERVFRRLGGGSFFTPWNPRWNSTTIRSFVRKGGSRMGQLQEAIVAIDEASQPYEGRWARLISTSNWEKGRIIHEWRSALQASEAAATECSDEAWSRRVGGVTGQHVGRLRRVYDRFGEVYDQFEGLYWSHFQASLDWDDAEMWLEGAIQNGWSVSLMRKARWEALGAPEALKPREEDIITSELNEDLDLREDATPNFVEDAIHQVQEPQSPAGPDFGDADDESPSAAHDPARKEAPAAEDQISVPSVRPFRAFERVTRRPDRGLRGFQARDPAAQGGRLATDSP